MCDIFEKEADRLQAVPATELNPSQRDMLAILRGTRDDRPTFPSGFRRELQHELDTALEDIDARFSVNKHVLSLVHQCEGRHVAVDEFHWSPRSARGTIAHVAIELSAGGLPLNPPFALVDSAIARIHQRMDTESLAEYLRDIDDAERAELRVSAADFVIKYQEMFPPLQDQWRINAESPIKAMANKRITLRGKIDLKLGSTNGNRSGSLIIDFKTGSPSFSDLDDLRFYALIETLRTGIPPFKWASVYLDSGIAEEEAASQDVLWSTMRRVTDGVRKIAELDAGREPKLTPGIGCRFCPSRSVCESAIDDYEPD